MQSKPSDSYSTANRCRLACRSWWLLRALFPFWQSMTCAEHVFAPALSATRELLDAALPASVRRAGAETIALLGAAAVAGTGTGTAGDRTSRAPLTWALAKPKMLQMVEPRFDELYASPSSPEPLRPNSQNIVQTSTEPFTIHIFVPYTCTLCNFAGSTPASRN